MLEEFKRAYINNLIGIWKYIVGFIPYVIIDQTTKTFFIYFLKDLPFQMQKVTDNFDFVYVWNYGASFGLFGHHALSNLMFFVMNSIITIWLVIARFSVKNKLEDMAYCLIIGGAVGNLIDRIVRGCVFDFIYLHCDLYNFPIFNGADFFISLGVFLLIYSSLYTKKEN